MEAIDLGALFFFRLQLARPWLDEVMKAVTHVGDIEVVISIAILTTVLFVLAKRPRLAMIVVVSALLSVALTESVKKTVRRQRPDPPNAVGSPPKSYSFPSGHSSGSMSVYGAIGLALATQLRRQRALVVFTGFFLSLVIGFSRMYLGVHYVFDVVAGWTSGLACVFFAFGMERAFFGGPDAARTPIPAPSAAPMSETPPDGIRPAADGVYGR